MIGAKHSQQLLIYIMHLNENVGDISIKDISQAYTKLEENTEYLTNIQRYIKNRKRIVLTPETLFDMKSIFNLMVQMSYLLYSCYRKKDIVIFLSKNLYVLPQKDTNLYDVIQDYLLKRSFDEMGEQQQRYIMQNFDMIDTIKHEKEYANYVLGKINYYYVNYIERLEKNVADKKGQKVDKNKELIINMNKGIKNFICPRIEYMSPAVLIRCLEQTEMFQTYSSLLKTLNSSLYESISKKQKLGVILKQIGQKQKFLADKIDHTMKRDIFKFEVIQEQLQKFFHFLLMSNVIDIEVSFNSNSSSMKDSSKGANQLGQTEKRDKNEQRKTTWKIRVQEKKPLQLNQDIIKKIINGQKIITQQSNDTKKYSQFVVEYIAEREILVIKYISQIEILLQNMDALMFHCNNMMFEWSNASVQELQRTPSSKNNQNTKVVQRVLAFKVVSHFNVKDDPLRNILLLIDLAMIYGKVAEPELKRNSIVKIDDHGRFITVGKKINHLTKLFIKKIRRVYDEHAKILYNQE